MNTDLDNIAEFKIPDVPPWTFSQLFVLFLLHNDKKSQTDPLVFRTKFHGLLSDFPNNEMVQRMMIPGPACVALSYTPVDTVQTPMEYLSMNLFVSS